MVKQMAGKLPGETRRPGRETASSPAPRPTGGVLADSKDARAVPRYACTNPAPGGLGRGRPPLARRPRGRSLWEVPAPVRRAQARLLGHGGEAGTKWGPLSWPVGAVPAPGPGCGRRRAAGAGRGAGAAGAGVPCDDLDRALRPRPLLRREPRAAGALRRGLAAPQPGLGRPRRRRLRLRAHGLPGAVRAVPRRRGVRRGGVRPVLFQGKLLDLKVWVFSTHSADVTSLLYTSHCTGHRRGNTAESYCPEVSACIPVFKLARRRKKILFYCHFPDLLLTRRDSFLKRLYRTPIDWIEEYTTGMADCILVNSQFTATIFKKTFKSLSHIHPDVLYPSLNFTSFDAAVPENLDDLVPKGKEFLFLSINRYERKKNLTLALEALVQLRGRLTSQDWERVHLIMAGGYDERVLENVEHFQELKKMVQHSDLGQHVTFLRSFSDKQKMSLLHNCTCVLYTPSSEHFGIVPVEAMYMQCPVIAVNSGGPLESIVHNVTGFLCEPDPVHFSEAIEKFIHNPSLKATMGLAGRARVREKFSSDAFTEKLYQYVTKLLV